MPSYTFDNGTQSARLGVKEIKERVIYDGVTPVPVFKTPVIIGQSYRGIPYNFDTLKETWEEPLGPFRFADNDKDVKNTWGIMGGDIYSAFRRSKRAGLPGAYLACAAQLTRASVVATSGGPEVNEAKLVARLAGALDNYTKIDFDNAGGILTITPPKNGAMIATTTATTDKKIYFLGNDPLNSPISWVKEGVTYTFGDNTVAAFTRVVESKGYDLDSNGQYKYWVKLTTAIGSVLTTMGATYAMMVEYGTPEANTTAFVAGEGQKIIDWVNTYSSNLICTAQNTFTGALWNDLSEIALKDVGAGWGTVAKGVSPLPTSSDWEDFRDNYQSTYWSQFETLFGITPYLHLILDDSDTVHGYWNDFLVERRENLTPCIVMSGCGFTDTSSSANNSTNPGYRAAALDSQSFLLFHGQYGQMDPYITLAADAFGKVVGAGSWQYTISQQPIATDGKITKFYTKAEIDYFNRLGAVTLEATRTTPIRQVFTVGVSTSQARELQWDPETDTTCMLMCRMAADYYSFGLRRKLEAAMFTPLTQQEARSIDEAQVGTLLFRHDEEMIQRGVIISRNTPTRNTIDAATGTIDLQPSYVPPTEILFARVTLNIVLGG